MTHAVDDGLAKAFPAAPWLLLPAEAEDVVTRLSKALGSGWVVERETDYRGEVSIIAMFGSEPQQTLAFILYEKAGQTRVATVRCDEWETEQGFASFGQAVNGLIAMASTPSSLPARSTRWSPAAA